MDKRAQQLLAYAVIIFAFLAGIALINLAT